MKQMTLEEISKAAASGAFRKIPVSREIYSDIRTPVETLKVLQGVSSHCYMLESVEDKKQWGRYTFLGYDPSLELTCVNGNLTITADAAEMKKVEDIPESRKEQLPTGQIRLTAKTAHPGAVIKTLIEKNKSPKIATLPTFTGGLVGYFSYDYIKYSEPTLKLDAEDQEHFKDVDLMLFDKVIAYDNYRQKIVLMINIETENLEENYEKAVQELEFLSNSSEKAAELSAKKAAEEKRLSALAETLTARRRATAEQVEEQAAQARQRAAASAKRLASASRRRADEDALSEADEKLLAALYALRKRLAAKQKLPAYMVFNDSTLRQMALKKPLSVEELLNIPGVGEKKAARYGQEFLSVIEDMVSSR